eukprot:7112988-Heterocapsa_arctica.AAC.1
MQHRTAQRSTAQHSQAHQSIRASEPLTLQKDNTRSVSLALVLYGCTFVLSRPVHARDIH